jgi:6-phosphogluconolactonase (cycloisomerase 2 family)
MNRFLIWIALGLAVAALIVTGCTASSSGGEDQAAQDDGTTDDGPGDDNGDGDGDDGGGEEEPVRYLVVLAEPGYLESGENAEIWVYPIAEDGSLGQAIIEPLVGSGFVTGFARNPALPHVYIADTGDDFVTPNLTGFALAEDGSLTELPDSPVDMDIPEPALLAVEHGGAFGYSIDISNNIEGFSIDADTGTLGFFDADVSLGIVAPGAIAAHPTLDLIYVFWEGDGVPFITNYSIDPDGTLAEVDGSTIAVPDNGDADLLVVSPEGSYLSTVSTWGCYDWACSYVSPFFIEADGALTDTGLTALEIGARTVAADIDLQGRFLFLSVTDDFGAGGNVLVYTIDPETGATALADFEPLPGADQPAGLALTPDDLYLYVADITSGAILAYAVDQETGALTQLAGSPFLSGTGAAFPVVIEFE